MICMAYATGLFLFIKLSLSMEDSWKIGVEESQTKFSKVTKRVLSSQAAKKTANFNTSSSVNRSQGHSETATVSDNSTQPSKQSKFSPKYPEKTPRQRKLDEFHNGFTPVKSSAPSSKHLNSKAAKEKPVQTRRSLFNQKVPLQESPRTTVRNPIQKVESSRAFISSPFKTASFKAESQETIFNRCDRQRLSYEPYVDEQSSFGFGKKRVLKTATPVQDWECEPCTPQFLGELPKPSVMKQEELRTCVHNYSPRKADVYEVCLWNIPQEYSEFIVRELLRGFHLVAVSIDCNHITGECTGTGKILMRTNYDQDIQALIVKLRKFGITAQVDIASKGRRNNFSEFFSENWQQRKEPQQPSPGKAREAKLKNLQSSIFS